MTQGLRERNKIEESSRSVSAGSLERPENVRRLGRQAIEGCLGARGVIVVVLGGRDFETLVEDASPKPVPRGQFLPLVHQREAELWKFITCLKRLAFASEYLIC
jgi:hypothetical protein